MGKVVMQRTSPFPMNGSSARLSDDGVYRYELTRRWGRGPTVTFIMLNPSTADATLDDPTIRRCKSFARSWEFGALAVVNLFALRATDPAALQKAPDPVGPENDDAIHDAIVGSRVVVAAWGTKGSLFGRDSEVLGILDMAGRPPLCLGVTKQGHPKHPLYVPANTSLIQVLRPRSRPRVPR